MSAQNNGNLAYLTTQYRMIHDIYVQFHHGDRRVFGEYGLTNSQYSLLCHLHLEEGHRLITLSDKLLCARSTITRLIDTMEESNLVKRIPDPEDRRAQLVVLTEHGLQKRQAVQRAHNESLVERMTILTIEECKQLNTLLEKLKYSLNEDIQAHDK